MLFFAALQESFRLQLRHFALFENSAPFDYIFIKPLYCIFQLPLKIDNKRPSRELGQREGAESNKNARTANANYKEYLITKNSHNYVDWPMCRVYLCILYGHINKAPLRLLSFFVLHPYCFCAPDVIVNKNEKQDIEMAKGGVGQGQYIWPETKVGKLQLLKLTCILE